MQPVNGFHLTSSLLFMYQQKERARQKGELKKHFAIFLKHVYVTNI